MVTAGLASPPESAWGGGACRRDWSFKGLVKVQQWQSFFALLEVVAFLVGLACLIYGIGHRDATGTVSGTVGPDRALRRPAPDAK